MTEKKQESLTEQQRLFCRKFVHLKRKKQAAIEAGYSPKSAQVQASKLLKMPKIMAMIARYESEHEARRHAAELIDAERILEELGYIGTADIRDIFTPTGTMKLPSDYPEPIARACGSIRITQHENGVVASADIKLIDKVAALRLLGTNKNLFNETTTHVHRLADMSLEQLVAERDRLHQDLIDTEESAKAHGVELDGTRH